MTPPDPRLLDATLLRLAARRLQHRKATGWRGEGQAVVLRMHPDGSVDPVPFGATQWIVLPEKCATAEQWFEQVARPFIERQRAQEQADAAR
jgi:hypothetical protein